MKVLASVFLYPIWHEKIGQPDPLAPGYVGRYSPQASATGFDTHELCQRVAAQEKPYTWQLMNWRIAVKEFAISGSEHNQRIRDLQFPLFLKETLLGNHRLVKQMAAESKHFLVDDTLAGLCTKMNALTGTQDVKPEVLQHTADAFDANFSRGDSVVNDDQIRRIEHARHWGPDRLRTCKPAPLQKPGARRRALAAAVPVANVRWRAPSCPAAFLRRVLRHVPSIQVAASETCPHFPIKILRSPQCPMALMP